MAIIAKSSEFKRDLVPAGTHTARAYKFIEIGTIKNDFDETKWTHRVIIGWELPNERKVFNPENGEQPFVISKEYTLSMYEGSNLRKDLESWRGKKFTDQEAKAFDVEKLLGAPCLLSVIHKEKKNGEMKCEVGTVMALPKGMTCPPQENPSFVLSYDAFDEAKFNTLPDFIKEKMQRSKEYLAWVAGDKTTEMNTALQEESFFKEPEDMQLPF